MEPNFQVLFAARWRLSSARSRRVTPGLAGFNRRSESFAALESRSYPMRAWIRRWFAEATDQAIIRVVATTVGLLAYIVWGGFFYFHPGPETSVACKANCSTEFSSRHRAE
jgi:hypothetical protein